jgi:predicted AlkP superfamily phosphohydrolase/phosphomutase
MRRVIAIGVDAASIALIEELADAGSLPNLKALRTRSVRVPLHSEPTHRHGVLWPQFVAGAEARLGGDWLRFTFDPTTYEAYQTGARHTIDGHAPFWETAQARVVTLDVPGTTVVGPGVHVTAWGASAPLHARASQPAGLLRELDARFGVHPGFGNEYDCGWHDPDRLDLLTGALEVGAYRRAEIAVELMARCEWDLFFTVMSESHSASEVMWHAVAEDHPLAGFDVGARVRLERVFRGIDRGIGHIVDHAPDDAAVVVFSLDGMRASHGDLPSIVLLPELMHRLASGAPKLRPTYTDAWSRAGCPPMVPPRHRPWRFDVDARLVDPPRPPWTYRVPGYQAARRTPVGRHLLERVKGTTLGALGVSIPPESSASPSELDGRHDPVDRELFVGNYRHHRHLMRAFALPTFGDAYVRVNLVGREAHGIVPIDELDAECAALEAMIRACRDVRTGAPIADRIERIAPHDPFALEDDRYGDLFVEWSRPIDAIEHPDVGVIGPLPFNRTGAHHEIGFAWVSGRGLAASTVEAHSVLDLPPTIVRLLDDRAPLPPAGAPIPEAAATRTTH